MPMIRTTTENDLLRFLYNELNEQKMAEVQTAIFASPALQEKLNELKQVKDELNQVVYKPSKSVLNNILNFSKGYEIHSA
jgi:hydroxyethylthiazole kinase-like sugar kinase family protein